MKKLIGYKENEISVKEQSDNYHDIVGIIYPGQSYYLTAPSLFYLQPIFDNLKIHYFGIDTQYGSNTSYLNASSEEKEKWVDMDSEYIGKFVNENTNIFKKRVFIGKSLGTVHLYNQIKGNYINKNDVLIFQTPVVPYDELQALLLEKGNQSLILYGTNDSLMKKYSFERIKSQKNVNVIEIENAGHSFEEDNKIENSINNLKNVMLDTEIFLEKLLVFQAEFPLTTAST